MEELRLALGEMVRGGVRRDRDGAEWLRVQETDLQGINNLGHVTVVSNSYRPVKATFKTFILVDDSYIPVAVPKGKAAEITALNNKGQIVGYFIDNKNINHAFLIDNSHF